jgi:hypothetical protein
MKRIIFVIILVLLTVTAQAQRRLPGQRGLQVTSGTVNGFEKNTFHCGAALTQFTKNKNRWTFGAEYLLKKQRYREQVIPVEQFTGEGGFYYTFLTAGGKTFFFTAGASGMMGYESVNRNEFLLYDGSTLLSQSKFLIGGALSFEIETYIFDRVILLTGVRQRILPTSTVNRFNTQLGVGIKFIIN